MTPLPFSGRKRARGLRAAGRALRVVVLGAGVAGLSAALQLDWDGCDVTVVEAREEPGGRVRTMRGAPNAGTLFELGAARFAAHHTYTRACLRWLGLELEPFYSDRGDLVTELNGSIRRRRVSGRSSADHLVLTQGLHAHRGFLGAIRELLVSPRWSRIRGGADQLPRGMAEALGSRVQYGTEVRCITQDGNTVRIECATPQGNGPLTLTADRVICTLPLPVLRHIGVQPTFPPDKQQLIAGLWYESAVRVALAMDPGWDSHGWSGFGWSDWFGELWPTPTVDEAGGRTLVWYAKGAHARALAAMAEPQRHTEARAALDRLVPGTGEHVRHAVSFVWDQDPWARGAQSLVWDYGIQHLPVIQRPEGRIHFAGEHTAGRHRLGWVDGALESGIRAAREVQEAG